LKSTLLASLAAIVYREFLLYNETTIIIITTNMNQEIQIRWDSYSTAKDALNNKSSYKLVVICFAEKWNHFSRYVALIFERLRMSGDVPYAQIFIIDSADNEAAWDYSIAITPAVIFFWEGKPFNIQRPNWDDDVKSKYLILLIVNTNVIHNNNSCWSYI
jgi:hypothetical protein